MAQHSGGKGIKAEEALRSYFLGIGYFTVRGVPFNYRSFDVTDVDLWLYIRSTPLSRERVCVDIKRKKTPQAMERIFWTKGLREVLGIERAIVVTSDNRRETRDFGAANGVTVLQNDFLQRVISAPVPTGRITEEEMFAMFKSPCVTDPSVVWARWYRSAKARLIEGLDFNTCNTFLIDIDLLLKEFLATSKDSALVARLLYLLISYFLISLDYASRSIVFLEINERKANLIEGLRYGEGGKQRTEEVVETALYLVATTGKADFITGTNIKDEFQKQLNGYPAEVLAEHFAKQESLKHLFELARTFESQAFATHLVLPGQCNSEQKAIIGLLCDFMGVDRRKVI